MAEIHVGQMIKDRMTKRGTSASWLARQLCCERTNIYSIYRRRSVDTALLVKLSMILEYDFFGEISRRGAALWGGHRETSHKKGVDFYSTKR